LSTGPTGSGVLGPVLSGRFQLVSAPTTSERKGVLAVATTADQASGAIPIRSGFLHAEDPALRSSGFPEWERLLHETPRFESDYRTPTSPNGLWYLLGHDDVYAVLRDTGLFSSRGFTHPDFESEYLMIPSEYDPPQHTTYRTALNPFFSPGRIAELEGSIRAACRDLVDQIVERGPGCDLLDDFALRFPTTVFLDMLGVPTANLEQFIEWTHAALHTPHSADPDGRLRHQADKAIHEFLWDVVLQRRRDPRDDIVSQLLGIRVEDGRPLDKKELLGILYLLFLAGLDTVSSMLGWSFTHLAEHSDDRQRVCDDPGVIPLAVDELLRYYSIVIMSRRVTEDTEAYGCPMRAGDRVIVPLASADRDPSAFPDAEKFVIDRFPNRHLAFGVGPHRCIGSHLARLEMRIALEEWHRRIPDYRLASDRPSALRVAMFTISLESVALSWDGAGT
jgi:cytochrome P450